MISYCIFLSQGFFYAISASEIRIVLSSYHVISTPIPNPHIMGLMNIYGDLYTAIDINPVQNFGMHKYCIVLKDIHIGILCEEVELIEIDTSHRRISTVTSNLPSYINNFIDIQNQEQIQLLLQKSNYTTTQPPDNIKIINVLELQNYIHQQSEKR